MGKPSEEQEGGGGQGQEAHWSTFALTPEYMDHAILGLDQEHRCIGLVLWPGAPTAPLRGVPCPTYLMDERGVVLMIIRLQSLLGELRTLPVPPFLPPPSSSSSSSSL